MTAEWPVSTLTEAQYHRKQQQLARTPATTCPNIITLRDPFVQEQHCLQAVQALRQLQVHIFGAGFLARPVVAFCFEVHRKNSYS